MCWKDTVGVDGNRCVLLEHNSVCGMLPIILLSYRDAQHANRYIKETEVYPVEYCQQILAHIHSSQAFSHHKALLSLFMNCRGCSTKLGCTNNSNMLYNSSMDEVASPTIFLKC